MKILVTGASGFIGGAIVEAMAETVEAQIVATGRSRTDRFKHLGNVTYFTQDLSEDMQTQACDVCIHCAGLADDKSTKEQLTTNNVLATSKLLAGVGGCRIFIFISSASVYDFSDGKMRSEEDADVDSATSLYGKSKMEGEVLVRNSGIQSVYILRPRAVYGKGDRVLLPRILSMIRNGRMIVPATLSKRTSLTNIQNLCEAVSKAIGQAKPGVHVFNIADRVEYDLKSVLLEILKRKTGKTSLVEIPTSILRALSLLASLLGNKARVTRQSLDYVTQTSVLNIAKAEAQLCYRGEGEFYEIVDELVR